MASGLSTGLLHTLRVSVSTEKGTITAYEDQLVVVATVTASSAPVANATVSFNDAFGSTWIPSVVSSNGTGVAITTVQLSSGLTGTDEINASVNASGYAEAWGLTNITELANSGTQLSVSLSLASGQISGGSTDIAFGEVFVLGDTSDSVSGATVTFSDSARSTFSSASVTTTSGGGFIVNFTTASPVASAAGLADFLTAKATASGYAGSQTTTLLDLTETGNLNLTVRFDRVSPSLGSSAIYNQMVVGATVTANGTTVANASVTFSDSFGETFNPASVLSNAEGLAVTSVDLASGNAGDDTLSATATLSGYSSGAGYNYADILGLPSTQLSVTETVGISSPTGGSTDVVYGTVFAGGSTSAVVPGATVAVSDSIGSVFSTTSTTTDASGDYWIGFAAANVSSSEIDVLTVSASASGYSGSSSSTFLTVAPYGSSELSVRIDSLRPDTESASLDSVTLLVTVTAGGTPVSGATVDFSDTLGSTFDPPAATTNASGVAFTSANLPGFYSGGLDLFYATASDSGYTTGTASAGLYVLAYGGNQLDITEALEYVVDSAGSANVVYGTVYDETVVCTGYFFGCYSWSYNNNPVANATVTLSDSSGSVFSTTSVLTNPQGGYAVNFTLPSSPTNGIDLVSVTAVDSGFSGSSSAAYVSINPTSSSVTFSERGLPAGTSWSVDLGGVIESSTTNSLLFDEGNGTYSYSILGVANYAATPTSGTVVVSGTGVEVSVTWSEVLFPVTFEETGLPTGTSWSVDLNGTTESSTTPSIVFDEANATDLPYEVSAIPGYTLPDFSGTLNVSGVPLTNLLEWSVVTYGVSFQESGLPAGTEWNVILGGSGGASGGRFINYTEPNGTFSFSVGAVSGYAASPSSGTVTVNGFGQTEAVTFTRVGLEVFALTFSETGLSTGTPWSVTVNGVENATTGTEIGFSEANGSFTYSVSGPAGMVATPSSGEVPLDGAPVAISIAFSSALVEPTTYGLTFAETGLATGVSWTVAVNGVNETTTTSSLVFSEPNGSFGWVLHSVSGYVATAYSGGGTIAGGPQAVALSFSTVSIPKYEVTFTESGLPSGTTWSVTLDGVEMATATGSVTFSEVNGSYSYSVGSVTGYVVTPGTGVATLAGGPSQVGVLFQKPSTTVYHNSTSVVNSTTSSSGLFGLGPGLSLGLLVILVVIAAAAGALIGLRLGKRRGPPEGSSPSPGSGSAGKT